MKKYTLCITQQCNLRCSYCYIDKRADRMPVDVARRIVDFVFGHASREEGIDIGFFGGEPLTEFELLREIVGMIERHPAFDRQRVTLSVVTNGTIFTKDIAEFLRSHGIVLCLSCDGPPHVHDRFRQYAGGHGSSARVTQTIRRALTCLPLVMVNAVYRPETLGELPETVEFLSGLGVRQIYLNPDVTAPWREADAAKLVDLYGRIGQLYIQAHLRSDPHFISIIDGKIAAILRGGYRAEERCQMGSREIAFSAQGNIYPCERLIGDGRGGRHCIGSILGGFSRRRTAPFCTDAAARKESPCAACGVREFCMNWCGCSNYLATGRYNGMSPFLCASERAAIATAFRVYRELESSHPGIFSDHLAGVPSMMSRVGSPKGGDRTSIGLDSQGIHSGRGLARTEPGRRLSDEWGGPGHLEQDHLDPGNPTH